MAFRFNYTSDPENVPRDAVRFLVGDTDEKHPLTDDREVAYALSQQPDTNLAAAFICDALAGKFSRSADAKVGDVSRSLSQISEAFANQAKRLRKASSTNALPFVGGLSISGKQALDSNTDAVQPLFRIGADDHPEAGSERDPELFFHSHRN